MLTAGVTRRNMLYSGFCLVTGCLINGNWVLAEISETLVHKGLGQNSEGMHISSKQRVTL